MEVKIVRRWLSPRTTIGEVYVNGQLECFSLEDFRREPGSAKVPKETCIPEGRYHCEVTHSPKFGRPLPLLWNVETTDQRRLVISDDGLMSFEGIRIHEGVNKDHTDGCVCVATMRLVDELKNSKPALASLQAKIQAAQDAHEKVWVTVELAPPAERAVC